MGGQPRSSRAWVWLALLVLLVFVAVPASARHPEGLTFGNNPFLTSIYNSGRKLMVSMCGPDTCCSNKDRVFPDLVCLVVT